MLKLNYCYCGRPVVVDHKNFKLHQLNCECPLDVAGYLTSSQLAKYYENMVVPQPAEVPVGMPTGVLTGTTNEGNWTVDVDDMPEEVPNFF